jgi:glutaredoxin-like protein NrdH
VIHLFSKPDCMQCTATKRELEKARIEFGLEYDVLDMGEHPGVLVMARALSKLDGRQGAPVVMTDEGEFWFGYQRDELKAYIAAEREKAAQQSEVSAA